MSHTPQQWQAYLHREIPITAAMGIEVARFDAGGVALRAPLALNHNDKATGFAGSLFTVAVLAGWSQVMRLLAEGTVSGQAVVSRSEVRFVRPARDDFTARVQTPTEAVLAVFRQGLETRGRAHLPLDVVVEAAGERVLQLDAQYAAIAV